MKRREKAVISLDQREMMELERIVIDGDSKEALSFLKKVIKKKMDQSSVSMGCGSAV